MVNLILSFGYIVILKLSFEFFRLCTLISKNAKQDFVSDCIRRLYSIYLSCIEIDKTKYRSERLILLVSCMSLLNSYLPNYRGK